MNNIGIYYAYWERNWDADFVPYIKKAKDLGFDILEVNSGTVTKMNIKNRTRLKEVAKDFNIELTFCIGLTSEYDLASEDEKTRNNGVEFLKRQAEMLYFMEAKKLSGIIYGSWPGTLPPGVIDKRPYWDRSVASMKEAIKTAEDFNVFFNVEVVNRFEQYLLNTASEAVQYVRDVGSDNCKILLDSFHMNIEEDSIYDAIIQAGDKLGHLHIGETNRRPPGVGRFQWDDLIRGIKKVGYMDSVVMEPFLVPGGEVGRDIKVFRDLSQGKNLDIEAKKALHFIRKIFE